MPARPVTEYTCDRCTRIWYEMSSDRPSWSLKMELSVEVAGASPSVVKFDCLCEGCAKTVSAVYATLSKDLKKSSPVRGAKKGAESKGKTPAPAPSPAHLAQVSASIGAELPLLSGQQLAQSVSPVGAPSPNPHHPKRQ